MPADAAIALKSMTTLNSLGEFFGQMDSVKAMTDVTGFGLLGHLAEMCEGSGVSAVIEFEKVPVIASIPYYLALNCIPGGTMRNWDSYGHKISDLAEQQRYILADPQTSGGLLVAVAETGVTAFEQALREKGEKFISFGFFEAHGHRRIDHRCLSFGTLTFNLQSQTTNLQSQPTNLQSQTLQSLTSNLKPPIANL